MEFVCTMAGVAYIELLCPAGRTCPSAAERTLAQPGEGKCIVAEITVILREGGWILMRRFTLFPH